MIKYICRYCGQNMGEIDHGLINDKQLGIESLTPQERKDIITYMSNGDKVIHIICEYCQETIEKNPELILISNPLQ